MTRSAMHVASHHRRARTVLAGALLTSIALAALCAGNALAQVAKNAPTPSAAADKDNAAPSKAETAKPPGDAKNASAKPPALGDSDRLSFDQSKVAAEMTELEERMFRLAETLKSVEPENSSRLRLALKNAREELILHQMKGTQEVLRQLKLGEALTEEKQILAKLQRLHDLLLSMDLDFQMRLERLRLIREALRQLDRAIKEEDREQKLSKDTAGHESEIAKLRQQRVTLEKLIARQTEHVEQGRKLSKLQRLDDPHRKTLAGLSKEQEQTRGETKQLAGQEAAPGSASKNLRDAESQMAASCESLKKEQVQAALPNQQRALESLKKESDRVLAELNRREPELAAEKFAAMQKDQAGNRTQTNQIGDLVRKVGDGGAAALAELIRAGGSMSSAEDALGGRKPAPASVDQERALQSLKYARDQLAQEAERLLAELGAEVRKRVLEGITLMLEKQTAVRESTVALQPQAKKGSRQAVASVVGLAQPENRIIEIDSELITLVEETEFGIALPAALRVVGRSMSNVKRSLGQGDASPPVVTAERQIEADLQALLEAMKQMPSSREPKGRPGRGQRDRERELNRLIAELKMVRILQVRVNGETVDANGQRPQSSADLPAALRKAIASVEEHQDEVRGTTQKLGEGRSEEIQ